MPASRCSLVALAFAALIVGQVQRLHAAGGTGAAAGVEQAVADSGKSGKPILAVAGRKSCGLCQALKQRFQSDTALQSILVNFVPLYIDLDESSPQEQQWRQQYPVDTSMLPLMYIVRADGKALHAGNPPKDGLDEFLLGKLREGGPKLTDKQKQLMTAAVSSAQSLVEAGNPIAAAVKLKSHKASGSFEAQALAVDKLWQQIGDQFNTSIDEAEKQLSADDAIVGAIRLLEISRGCVKTMPDVAKRATALITAQKKSDDKKDLFKQAELVVKADALSAKKSATAPAAYQAVIDKFPDTPAAKLASDKLASIAK